MAIRKLVFQATQAHRGLRLDHALGSWLPERLGRELSKAKTRKLIVAGAVYLNGRRVRIASKELLPGARIEVYLDEARLLETDGPSRDKPFVMEEGRILYEDDCLIAIDKPAGLPTQPTLDEARSNAFAALKTFLLRRDGGHEAYVGLHHRLDRDTSGVLLFTKKASANAGVSRLFSEHLARKTYWALVAPGRAAQSDAWSVSNFLGRARDGAGKPSRKGRFASVRSGGDPAHTDFRVLERRASGLWVEAMPRTGRTHQIRVHLSEGGLPILGDPTYGGAAASAAPRLMLHARSLEFPHPVTGVPVRIESPMPEDFRARLEQLRQ
jgi:RluA family pseudouridine synthase